jgi:hypothetical protein
MFFHEDMRRVFVFSAVRFPDPSFKRFLSVACLNPLLGTLMAAWAGDGMGRTGSSIYPENGSV